MQRRRVMLAAKPESDFPPGYTRLEYISNPNGGYINPDILWHKGDIITIKFLATSAPGNRTLVSYRWKGNYREPYQCIVSTGSKASRIILIGKGLTDGDTASFQVNAQNTLVIDSESDVVTLNGGLFPRPYSTALGTLFDDSGSSVLVPWLFAPSGMPTVEIGTVFYIFEYSIQHGGVYAAKMLPCINPNGEKGMYDTARKRFFGSANGKTFEGG